MKLGEHSMPSATNRPSFLDSPKIDIISRMEREFHFGPRRAMELTKSQNLWERSAGKIWKARKSAPSIAPDTMAFSLKTLMATNWKSAVASSRSLRVDEESAKSSLMSEPAH